MLLPQRKKFTLPKMTASGCYWLEEPGHAPCILMIKKGVNAGKFSVSTPKGGIAFDKENKTQLLAFKTADMALIWIQLKMDRERD